MYVVINHTVFYFVAQIAPLGDNKDNKVHLDHVDLTVLEPLLNRNLNNERQKHPEGLLSNTLKMFNWSEER